MPDVAPAHKIAAVRRLGAEVVLVPPAQRAERAASLAAERGLQPVPPFDHPDVIAGQGTVGLEIVADLPVDVVLVPVGERWARLRGGDRGHRVGAEGGRDRGGAGARRRRPGIVRRG